jgi:PKD repeat protein
VVCTDTSTNTPVSWLWNIIDVDGDLRFTSTTRNFTWLTSYAGLYSVNLQATNSGGSDWENKTNYVTISAAVPTVTPTPTPTPSTGIIETNISIFAKTQSGAGIQNAYVELHNGNQGHYGAGTDINGRELFQYVSHTNGEIFHLKITKSGYQDYIEDFTVGNVPNINITAYMLAGVSPTPTPAPYDVWYLDAMPNSINLGDSSWLHLYSSNSSKFADEAGIVIYYENKNLGGYFGDTIIGIFLYNTTTSNWDFKPSLNAPYNFLPNDPTLFEVIPTTTGTYTYSVGVSKLDSSPLGSATTDLLINNGGIVSTNLIMTLGAINGATTSHLQNYTLILTEAIGGISHTYDITYDTSINLQRGKVFTLTGQKIGYIDNTITFTVPFNQAINNGDFGTFINVPLFQYVIPNGNTSVTVHVDDKDTYMPIPNVQITMTGFLTPKFTGTSGESVSFIIPQNTEYTTSASKDGYCAVSETKNTSTLDYQYVDLYLKYGSCIGVTPTHTPIPTIPAPTPTILGVTNTTYDTGVCYSNWSLVPKGQSLTLSIKNYLACAGILDSNSQNLVIALFLILIVALIGAWKASGLGFGIGAVIGATISMALGLFPIWLIIVMIILIIGIIAIKVFSSGG